MFEKILYFHQSPFSESVSAQVSPSPLSFSFSTKSSPLTNTSMLCKDLRHTTGPLFQCSDANTKAGFNADADATAPVLASQWLPIKLNINSVGLPLVCGASRCESNEIAMNEHWLAALKGTKALRHTGGQTDKRGKIGALPCSSSFRSLPPL